MDNKKPNFDMTTLGEMIDRKINSAKTDNSTLQKLRKKNLAYFNRSEPKQQHPRQASYITTDVYNGVMGMAAQIDDTVNTGREILQFSPQGSQDVVPSRIASAYTNYVVFRQNNGRKLIQTITDDGLKGTNGFCKVYWRVTKVAKEESFGPIPAETAFALAQRSDVEEFDADIDPVSGMASGTFTRIHDRSQVVIDPIAPEDFGIDPRAKNHTDSFHYVRSLMTRSEMEEQGLNTKKLKDVTPDGDRITSESTEADARHERHGGIGAMMHANDSEADNPFWVYECYDHLTPKGGKRGLYKITRVSGVTLDIEEVDRSPVIVYTPLPIAHSFIGISFAQLLIPEQNARTTLMRAILDHSALATNPRYTAVKGGLPNPKELLQPTFGGVVNVEAPDSIGLVPQPMLNQFLFPTMEFLKANAEQTTGLSALSLGQNKDVISNQNSQAMISDQVDLAMTLQKTLIRNLAYDFLRELFLEVYRLVLEHETKQNIIDVAGEYVEVDPRRFIERRDCEVVLHLTPNDAQAELQKYTALMSMGAQDPDIARMLGANGGKNKYNLAIKMMQAASIKNYTDYITDPALIPPSQPDPAVVAQMQMAQKQTESGFMAAQATLLKAQTDQTHKAHADQMAEMQAQLNAMKAQADAMRKDMETMSRIDLAHREQSLNESMAQTAPDAVRGISSPSL